MSDRVIRIAEITTAETHPLRRIVLRDNDPDRPVGFPEDDLPGTIHLAARDESDAIVAISSWVPKECADAPGVHAVQLRGMATASEVQGSGVGGMLFEAGVDRAVADGFELLWARARDAALNFYLRHGCRVVGDGFVDATTQLPHHIVLRDLR